MPDMHPDVKRALDVGFHWKPSDEAKRDIEAIERAVADGFRQAQYLFVGAPSRIAAELERDT